MRFSVWAPAAKTVELIIGDQRIAMQAQEGRWQVDAALNEDQGYRFSLDGGPPLPDPRSRRQRDGVHGASFLVDPGTLRDVASSGDSEGFQALPLRDAIIYELHVGTFTAEGTYRAAQGRLAHLKNLGVTHVELLPLATFPAGMDGAMTG